MTKWLVMWATALVLLPSVAYWWVAGSAPSVTAEEAKAAVEKLDAPVLLIDVRDRDAFLEDHITGSENWPSAEILAIKPGDDVLKRFAGKRAYLIDDGGLAAPKAAQHLSSLAVDAVFVRGGIPSWIAEARKLCAAALLSGRDASVSDEPLFYRPTRRYQQILAALMAFMLKPLYMLGAVVLIYVLRHASGADLKALRLALVLFFIGEGFCAANTHFLDRVSVASEYSHNVLMVFTFALTTYALLVGIDRRLIKRENCGDLCAARELCGECTPSRCGLEKLFVLLIPVHAVLAAIPLTASTHMASYNTSILGAVYSYTNPVLMQLYEIRLLPIAAIALFCVSWLALIFKKHDGVDLSRALFAAGMGALGFSMLRLVLFSVYRDELAMYSFWEEATEMLYVAGVAGVLCIFRRGLLRET